MGSPTLALTDRRRQPRYRISASVKMGCRRGIIPATATNISNNGIEVQSAVDVRHDSQVHITIGIPDEVTLYGTAVWSLRLPNRDAESYRIGFAVYGVFNEGSVYSDLSSIEGIVGRVVSEHG